MVDLGLAAKVRPCLVISIPALDQDRALASLVPHTTSVRGTRFEIGIKVNFLHPGAFDPEIVEKLSSKHGVEPEEAEEVFFNKTRFWFVENGYRAGEDVYAGTGQTDTGRYLIVFFVHKADKTALILSARDMEE